MLPLSFYTVLPFDLQRTCELLRVALEVRGRTSSGARSFGAGTLRGALRTSLALQ